MGDEKKSPANSQNPLNSGGTLGKLNNSLKLPDAPKNDSPSGGGPVRPEEYKVEITEIMVKNAKQRYVSTQAAGVGGYFFRIDDKNNVTGLAVALDKDNNLTKDGKSAVRFKEVPTNEVFTSMILPVNGNTATITSNASQTVRAVLDKDINSNLLTALANNPGLEYKGKTYDKDTGKGTYTFVQENGGQFRLHTLNMGIGFDEKTLIVGQEIFIPRDGKAGKMEMPNPAFVKSAIEKKTGDLKTVKDQKQAEQISNPKSNYIPVIDLRDMSSADFSAYVGILDKKNADVTGAGRSPEPLPSSGTSPKDTKPKQSQQAPPAPPRNGMSH